MKKQRTLSAKLSSDWTTHSISDSMTRLRFSSAESLEEDAGDCDARNRRAAAGRRRGRGTGARPKWRARRARAERGEDEDAVAARRRSRAARNADDMVAELFGCQGASGGRFPSLGFWSFGQLGVKSLES
jgi:hypothetical protein